MAAASRNDAAPVFSIFLECLSLERIDLVADNASDGHWRSPGLRQGCSSAPADGEAVPIAAMDKMAWRRSIRLVRNPAGHMAGSIPVAMQRHFA